MFRVIFLAGSLYFLARLSFVLFCFLLISHFSFLEIYLFIFGLLLISKLLFFWFFFYVWSSFFLFVGVAGGVLCIGGGDGVLDLSQLQAFLISYFGFGLNFGVTLAGLPSFSFVCDLL